MPRKANVPAEVVDRKQTDEALRANPEADTEDARELAEFLELVRTVRELAEPDCAVDAMSIEQFKGDANVIPSRE